MKKHTAQQQIISDTTYPRNTVMSTTDICYKSEALQLNAIQSDNMEQRMDRKWALLVHILQTNLYTLL